MIETRAHSIGLQYKNCGGRMDLVKNGIGQQGMRYLAICETVSTQPTEEGSLVGSFIVLWRT
jgi:hypothetical protein